jgi:hypothetical protein
MRGRRNWAKKSQTKADTKAGLWCQKNCQKKAVKSGQKRWAVALEESLKQRIIGSRRAEVVGLTDASPASGAKFQVVDQRCSASLATANGHLV